MRKREREREREIVVMLRQQLLLLVAAAVLLAGSTAPAEGAAVPPTPAHTVTHAVTLALKNDDEPPVRIWKPPPGEDEDALRREAAARKYDPERIKENERGRKAWLAQEKQRRLLELEGKQKPRVKPLPPPL